MKYATFDGSGVPAAFYDEEIHGSAIPEGTIEISDEQWREFIENQGLRRWDGQNVVPYEPPPSPVFAPILRPVLATQAQLTVDGEDIAGVETSCGLGAAMALEPHIFWLFFAEPQPDTNYLPIVQAPGFNADTTYPLNPDFLEITVTDRASGEPAVPTQLVVSTQRVR